ncbi:MAG: SAM-dependent methyltransferase [Chloroflexi bacterium]|nr:MAG: SAM-dependent methyltransferase [Chloroflexota bacterium]
MSEFGGLSEDQRAALLHTVITLRRHLEDDLLRRLEGDFGVHPNGTVEPLDALPNLDEAGRALYADIVAALEHQANQGMRPPQAVRALVHEVAFTWLNRLAALRLLEERGVFPESLRRGLRSNGFLYFAAEHPPALSLYQANRREEAYLLYLRHLCAQMNRHIQVLFDVDDLPARLTPSYRALLEAVDALNATDLAAVWNFDETLGWIYQYFTPREQREQARSESAAPRNREELAVRNQFYTPRYGVAFLTENTLGALWAAMRKGDTALLDRCTMLIRPRTGWPHVPAVDPRELTVLDPACGSGHFLLYAFDLLLTIYEEAYDDESLGRALRSDFPDREAFRRAIPRLIVEHNLFGIDIDLRAVQIAALSLFLRAHRAWQRMGVRGAERPSIERMHLAVAEPMPGEVDLLKAFVRGLRDRVPGEAHHAALGKLIHGLWALLQQADELGSLLRLEADLHRLQAELHAEWKVPVVPYRTTLVGPDRQPVQRILDLGSAADRDFWENLEALVLDALQRFAEEQSNGRRALRRLFARDAARGWAFLETLQRRYWVVLMNPPFGEPVPATKDYLKQHYPRSKQDLYAAFVERGLELLHPGGRLGAITSRTGFFLKTFQAWREEILMGEGRLVALADLGYGVLDTAMVETAAYVVEKPYLMRSKGGTHAFK